jgi:hypothetical protein
MQAGGLFLHADAQLAVPNPTTFASKAEGTRLCRQQLPHSGQYVE